MNDSCQPHWDADAAVLGCTIHVEWWDANTPHPFFMAVMYLHLPDMLVFAALCFGLLISAWIRVKKTFNSNITYEVQHSRSGLFLTELQLNSVRRSEHSLPIVCDL